MEVTFGLQHPNHELRRLIPDLCRQFYSLGWVSGTGGGIAIREDDEVLVAPSGVQKDRLTGDMLFVVDLDGNVIKAPSDPDLRISECWPLFQHAFLKRGAGAVIHSHSINTVLAVKKLDRRHLSCTWNIDAPYPLPGKVYIGGRTCEMVKGLRGKGYEDDVQIPIINNTARECDLAESLGAAMDAYPDVDAVIVRNHGIYVWGETWQQAKTQAECFDYLLQLHRSTP